MPKPKSIILRKVEQNNLKGFDLELELGQLIVVTGLSGSGKSSLVFETLHAEGQRRYVETFSPYTRQFLEMLDRPKVDSIENIHPSIAIQQGNTVKTSRSTVGTMTELCDFFKVWFCHQADLFDPETGKKVEDDNPQTVWKKALRKFKGETVLLTFSIIRPEKFTWDEILASVTAQGFTRILVDGKIKKITDIAADQISANEIHVIQDRIKITPNAKERFIEGASSAFHFGKNTLFLFTLDGTALQQYSEGLHAPESGKRFRPAQPATFSFNSPIGACPRCRGFGRIIEIDYRLVIPDTSLSIEDDVIRAFTGEVYQESKRDLIRACKRKGISTKTPYSQLTEKAKQFIIEGEPDYVSGQWEKRWYGVRRFFNWLEENTYKMHVRVFLSKYRTYSTCPDCNGTRLKPEALNWKWNSYTLPELYKLPIKNLLQLLNDKLAKKANKPESDHQIDIAEKSILSRLNYLDHVGLGYLSLDRSSRSLSGGEVERVNLTSCLGTSLVDTLFILDEPSVGLHSQDIQRLINILKQLKSQGNTVVVVEHDETIIRAADTIVEIGPKPGKAGGEITFLGNHKKLASNANSLTGAYLSGKQTIAAPKSKRPVTSTKKKTKSKTLWAKYTNATKHNINNLSFQFPLNRLVCFSGVSGSGKSTLLNNVIYQGLLNHRGKSADDPATIKKITFDQDPQDIVLVDQSPISRTPRSNAAIFSESWNPIRTLFSKTEAAKSKGLTPSEFSFNGGSGRCDYCNGLGYERVEMQFMADVYVNCPVCEGKRFKPEILTVKWNNHSLADILQANVADAIELFEGYPKITAGFQALESLGLGYLPLGQPLNTLSGGESQRLKLVKYLAKVSSKEDAALILLDEPTTGLHRDDVKRLIAVLQNLVDLGNSVVVIEHQLDVLKSADWLIEMGPGAGNDGGKIIFEGKPEDVCEKNTPSAPFLRQEFAQESTAPKKQPYKATQHEALTISETKALKKPTAKSTEGIEVSGARVHNLKNISLRIQHGKFTVITGVSGSGKSSLAFDILFAEGQRRFMESMSAYARQFVEQLPRPDIDTLTGIPPTVAIEQRVTHGTRKSTVATITEVAQYLRLLYARVGHQHSLVTGEPLISLTPGQLLEKFKQALNKKSSRQTVKHLCAPVIRSRKGHHQPLATWAQDRGYKLLRVDGKLTSLDHFEKLDRYREHDIDVVVASYTKSRGIINTREDDTAKATPSVNERLFKEALNLGKGSCFLIDANGPLNAWFSTQRSDPATGESFPELDPKHFSWNSPKGWCSSCRGYGIIYDALKDEEDIPEHILDLPAGSICPDCNGERLNPVSRSVYIHLDNRKTFNLPELLQLTPQNLVKALKSIKLDKRGKAIVRDLIPEIEERLKFMNEVGLNYLTLDRSTATLSGGEAQRIRLAAQLGSNLSGVLYILDEPSIGLHARDNEKLLQSLKALRDKGNTLLVVEHDDTTMKQADQIIDLGPGAGIHGGEVLANGSCKEILRNKKSLTGQYLKTGIPHPLRGSYRKLTRLIKSKLPDDWFHISKPSLRNLKGNDLFLPKNKLIMVCGISGAGKSTLVRDLLKPCIAYASKNNIKSLTGKAFLKAGAPNGPLSNEPYFDKIINTHDFRQVIEVDHSPIGKTPRSTPATYIGAFDIIRKHFSDIPESRMQGHTASTYSFNTKGGRCESCKGAGRIKLEMNFMPDTYVHCENCSGTRYGPELEDIRWKDKNINEILAMSFDEAAEFFSFHKKLETMLKLMVETGLGYLTLGQSSPTLSGGEAQRLKLVSELAKGIPTITQRTKTQKQQNLYILEEPTIGLHLSDCEKLIELLHRLVDQGHTVIVIEHHIDLIAEADYLVEIGPEGGDKGGRILYQGNVAGIKKLKTSPTGAFLK